ncbi:MAG: hypothetical protein H8E84_08790 [Flavobacteriales bacterium]|nr:hypothetical protein [Flavobacteriales bacterium]
MKKLITTIVFGLIIISANAQIQKLAGPRIGITLLTPGWSADIINEGFDVDDEAAYKVGSSGSAFISQYGWQWESRFADGEKVVGIVEWIALVGGIEKGLFLPSASSLVGLRSDAGIEFAAGPNISLSGFSMLISAGYNFKFGNLNVPLNIIFVPNKSGAWGNDNKTGARISLMAGFNMTK